jgi:uncharacterized membrane protein
MMLRLLQMRVFRKLLIFSAPLIMVAPLAMKTVNAQDASNFKFSSFSADYYLDRTADKTATLKVVETLVAVFPDSDQNHGILRAIPKTYQDHTLSLNVDSVANEYGSKLRYTDYKEKDNLVLKIGDANHYVHGQQTYVITYELKNVALLQKDHDEFYWDVNGDQWGQVFDSVSAHIHIPTELAQHMQSRKVCYGGKYGQTNVSSCTIKQTEFINEAVVDVTSNTRLNPYETLTFALAFNNGTFELGPEIAHEQQVKKIKFYASIAGISIPPTIAFIFMFRRWREFGDDPKGRGVIIPEYEPPKGFNVVSSDYMLNQKISPKAFSAGLIELAVKKYMTISEIKIKHRLRKDSTDYELELIKNAEEADDELQKVAKAVFDTTTAGAKIKISEIKASTTTRTDIYKAIIKLGDDLANKLWKKEYFVKNPKAVKTSYQLWAILPLVVGIGIAFFAGAGGLAPVAWFGAGLIFAAVVMLIYSFYMPARTEKGVQVHDDLLGLKDYIKMAEADRLKFGQSAEGAEKIAGGSFDPDSPKTKVKLFESLLPYAILFGLEKSWAGQFEDIYKAPPDWYNGNMHTFNTIYLALALSDFSSASAVSFAPPSSSSSGGFSGGFSGGGGGGGGGGGW